MEPPQRNTPINPQQNVVCVVAIQFCKSAKIITYRDFNADEARKWFPISLLLITMIYTSSKALQFLSIPVYTIFKNLTIILIAYGEVLWFGGSVSGMALFSFGLMVLSSIIAAWADISTALSSYGDSSAETAQALSTLNAGYIWVLVNCLSSASYVLGMRKRIKLTNFKDFDSSSPVLLRPRVCPPLTPNSNVLQQPPLDPRPPLLLPLPRRLVLCKHQRKLPRGAPQQPHHRHDIQRPLVGVYLIHLRVVCPCYELDDV